MKGSSGSAGPKCKALAGTFQPPSAGLICTGAGLQQAEAGRRCQHSFSRGALPSQGSHLPSEPENWLPPFSESGSIWFLLPWLLRSSSIEVGHSSLPQTKKTCNWDIGTHSTYLGTQTSQNTTKHQIGESLRHQGEC